MALILIGLLLLVGRLSHSLTVGMMVLPTLAIIFLAWGLLTRTFGLVIPGGILMGVGLGTILVESPPSFLARVDEGALFLLAFSAGWALITLLSPLADGRLHWWPLIPGGVMAAIGGLILLGELGAMVLEWSGFLWPLVLVLLGLYILFRRSEPDHRR
ncbi:MAG: hypothetical protein D6775_04635 [Caldilineae bacterium]|nr:MAG: hypothetical protein D6775_04635 [Caldilineae bacterium]